MHPRQSPEPSPEPSRPIITSTAADLNNETTASDGGSFVFTYKENSEISNFWPIVTFETSEIYPQAMQGAFSLLPVQDNNLFKWEYEADNVYTSGPNPGPNPGPALQTLQTQG